MTEPTETELLLPWYVTGKLSDKDRARVDAWLKEHPDAAGRLDDIRLEMDETIAVNQDIRAPAPGGLDRLMTRLDSEFGPAPDIEKRNWWQKLAGSLSDAMQIPVMRHAAIAAALIIAIQAASIAALVHRPAGPANYETASGPADTAGESGSVLLVKFASQATAARISALLEETGGTIIKGPAGGGIYLIRFEKRKPAAEKKLIASLRAKKDIISFVAPNG
ncbi:MAG TPA: hypothetical protein ENJ99_02885 [Rhizobiales bacterium]|nr:hypothetical protein [Hyphomicrobiales bacterium]